MALTGSHERLADRLARILILLNQGERLTLQKMADLFDTSVKTCRRDIERLDAIGLMQDEQKRYYLPDYLLGKLNTKDIEKFALLTGVRDLFPQMGGEMLRNLFEQVAQGALLVKGHRYEALESNQQIFTALRAAIEERRCINFQYKKQSALKSYSHAQPYRLINDKGVWYLAAVDGGKLKSFVVSKIHDLIATEECFEQDKKVLALIEKDEGIWFGEELQEVVLTVNKDVADYFKRRAVVPYQHIDKELEDGTLIVSAKIAHPAQILPIVRFWIPNVRILSPENMQATMEQQLKDYLK